MKRMRLDRLLASQLGLCERSNTRQWARSRKVTVNGENVSTKSMGTKVLPHEVLVDGKPLEYVESLTLALNKPRGYVCSRTRDNQDHEIVYDLLPDSFYFRRPFLNVAGRLDKWASGLLVMTQGGDLLHRLCSPRQRRGHPKRLYEIELARPLDVDVERRLGDGTLVLRNEIKPLRPVGVRVLNDHRTRVELTLHEGRYHQIRRMLAAVDNRALSIHRAQLGLLRLDELDIGAGQWRLLTDDEIKSAQVPADQ
jgi:16S rRNA pseudouridine516 synthase